MFKLVGTGKSYQHSFHLESGELTVGREKTADIVINDSTVSKLHAIIGLDSDEQKIYVIDKGSKNGTIVNGAAITERVYLRHGDKVAFGQTEFVILRDGGNGMADVDTVCSGPTRLSEHDPDNSVIMSVVETLEPLPSHVADHPQILPALFEMAKILVLPEPQEEMLRTALKLVHKVIPADRLAIITKGRDSEELITLACLLAGGKEHGGFSISRTVANQILTQKSSILVNPRDDARFASQESIIRHEITSAMAVPLFDGGLVLGILYVDTTNPVHRYNNEYLRLLATFGNLIVSRLLNYELIRERQEREIFAAELRRASMIQQNLLTKVIPPVAGYQIHAFQEQCSMVGGDLYDLAKLPDGRLVFVVADVSGKGMGGALLMSNILASFRILYEESDFTLDRALRQVSHQLYNYSAPEDFATVFAGLLDISTHKLTFINAGHNPPLLVRPDGTIKHLEPSGTMIGAFDNLGWKEETIGLSAGDLLVVFTDGVVDAARDEQFYGLERLERIVGRTKDKKPADIIDAIMNDVNTFAAGAPRADDITLLAIKRE